jgi:two-component system, sensor histidine kinase and response regulator
VSAADGSLVEDRPGRILESDRGPAEQKPGELVVVIDDDYAMRVSCDQILKKSGYEARTFEDGTRGLLGVADLKPSLVVVDLKMPGLSGMDVIRRIREIDPEIVVVVITGYATIGTAVEAMKAGAYDFLPKPFKPDELRLIVARAHERYALRRKSRELEMERELMKRRFISFMTHQLKSPLTAVYQYLDVLKRLGDSPEATEKRAEWLDRCLKRTGALQMLIDDWLLLAKSEGTTLVRKRERVDLRRVLKDLMASHEESARSGEIGIEEHLPAMEYPIWADRICVGVLFDNLISNAIGHNRRGGQVLVSARGTRTEVVVEIRDTGPGIPEEALEFLFEEFFRVRGSDGDGEGGVLKGTGLGLAICKRIAGELGGAIEVESKVGEGSVFRVNLPAYSEVEWSAPEGG